MKIQRSMRLMMVAAMVMMAWVLLSQGLTVLDTWAWFTGLGVLLIVIVASLVGYNIRQLYRQGKRGRA